MTTDYCTKKGCMKLIQMIRHRWKGKDIEFKIERIGNRQKSIYYIRSNMKNGLPKKVVNGDQYEENINGRI